jgi:MFS family permease
MENLLIYRTQQSFHYPFQTPMTKSSRMSPLELRASLSLAAIFGLRLFGMFIILPVFVIYAEHLEGGRDMALVGIAMGAYGLTQAVLQIPFGWWSDRYGRKPVIYAGLMMFALGSFVAAAATSVHLVIVGRILQGAGAISGAVIAMVADLTREEHRTKAMALIGSTIGIAFALSLVVSPVLNRLIGVPGIFALTGFLALAAVVVVWRIVPTPTGPSEPARGTIAEFKSLLSDGQLLRLNYGIFALHALLMAMFIALPLSLRDAGLPVAQHWHVYLPVMLLSFVLMMPAVMRTSKGSHLKGYFVFAVALVLLAQVLLYVLPAHLWPLALVLLVFFTAFNVLEAMLPSLISRMAPPQSKGAALGIYSSVQFLGTFVGSALGGYAYGQWGAHGVTMLCGSLAAVWLVVASGMKVPDRPVRAGVQTAAT